MTTTPDGEPVAVEYRLSEIRERYGPLHLVSRFINLAESDLVGAVRHVQRRVELCGADI